MDDKKVYNDIAGFPLNPNREARAVKDQTLTLLEKIHASIDELENKAASKDENLNDKINKIIPLVSKLTGNEFIGHHGDVNKKEEQNHPKGALDFIHARIRMYEDNLTKFDGITEKLGWIFSELETITG